MGRLGGDRVVVVTSAPALDENGDPRLTDLGRPILETIRVPVDGCSWEYTGGTETNTHVNPTEIDGRVFMPPDTVVPVDASIEYAGLLHAVQTPPRPWTDELGRPDYLLVDVRYSKG